MAQSDEQADKYKIVVLGAGAVGKSSLTVRYVTGDFLDEYDPTIEDYYRKLVEVDGEPAYMDILDTAGQEEFSSMQDEFFRQGKGFLLIYSIISKDSFEHAKTLRDKIKRARDDPDKKLALVLCGNKCDLEIQRQVQKSDGVRLCMSSSISSLYTLIECEFANIIISYHYHIIHSQGMGLSFL